MARVSLEDFEQRVTPSPSANRGARLGLYLIACGRPRGSQNLSGFCAEGP